MVKLPRQSALLFPLHLVKTQREFLWRVVDHTISTNFSSLQAVIRAIVAHTKCEINNLMKLEDLQINPSFCVLQDQGSNIAWSEKKAKKPFPYVKNVLALRKPTFSFKYHPNLCKQKAQITVRSKFRREFAYSFMDEIFMTFKDQNHFLNYICFIFIHLANKAFQITVKTPDVVHFEFLDLS